jgi:hypothetical protein
MVGKGKRVALYLRVSTDGQTTKNQRDELEQHAKQAGWRVTEVYKDHGISGAKEARQAAGGGEGRGRREGFAGCRHGNPQNGARLAAWYWHGAADQGRDRG